MKAHRLAGFSLIYNFRNLDYNWGLAILPSSKDKLLPALNLTISGLQLREPYQLHFLRTS